jgi:hypothetical protein
MKIKHKILDLQRKITSGLDKTNYKQNQKIKTRLNPLYSDSIKQTDANVI